MLESYDICVIGAGPGGYVAAIYAGRTGAKVALIEKEHFGGTCLNVGCIPTKALLACTDTLRTAKHSPDFGINIDGEISFDWTAMLNRKDSIIEKLRTGIGSLLKNANVTVYTGTAAFEDKNNIAITSESGESETITSAKTIIATGSKPAMPGFIPKSPKILDSTDLLNISEVPKSLIILGGGVIGCEFACLFSELGTEITIVEMLPEILPEQDIEVSKQMGRELKKRKMKVLTGKPLENITVSEEGVAGIAGKKELSADYMLVSIGRLPVTDGLNIGSTGVLVDKKGFIPVDNQCRTNIPGIFAIGDVTGRIQLAHLASAMAVTAAENACGSEDSFSDRFVPGCIFTNPEIGSVGLTQQQCTEQGIEFNIGKFPFAALGKAMAINEPVGFCKIIADSKSDHILGVHIIGPHATDLIAEAVTALEQNMSAAELGKVIHAHPTLGEIMMEAAHAVHEKSVHIPVMKKR